MKYQFNDFSNLISIHSKGKIHLIFIEQILSLNDKIIDEMLLQVLDYMHI